MNEEINVKDINRMSDLSFAKAIGVWGGSFLVHYINNADINEEYTRRLSNLVLVREDIYLEDDFYVDYSFDIPGISNRYSILDALNIFKNIDKIKIIDAIGDVNFLENFEFPIKIDLVVKEEIPVYLKHLMDSVNNNPTINEIFMDIIIKEISNSEKIYNAAHEIFEFYDYNVNGYMQSVSRGFFDLGYSYDRIKVTEEEAEEVDMDDIVELIELTKPYMKDVVGWYLHVLEIIDELAIVKKYKKVGGNIDDLSNRLYKSILSNLIYFHDGINENLMIEDFYDDVDFHIGISPMFFYEKDEEYENKEELLSAIMGYVS